MGLASDQMLFIFWGFIGDAVAERPCLWLGDPSRREEESNKKQEKETMDVPGSFFTVLFVILWPVS